MKEGSFAEKVDAVLKSKDECWFFNVQGGSAQRAGIPDRIICYRGIFIGLELKRPDGKGVVSPRQRVELAKINKARGYGFSISSLSELEDILTNIDYDIDSSISPCLDCDQF